MPFTVNVGPYQGGQFLAQGLGNLGQGIGQGIQEYNKAQQEQAANDMIVDFAVKNNMLPIEERTKYTQGNANVKSGIVAGLARTFAMQQAQQQMQALEEQRKAQAELRRQQAEAFNFVPRAVTLGQSGYPFAQAVNPAQEIARPGGTQLIETKKGQWEIPSAGEGALGAPKIIPAVDPVTGERLPFNMVTYGKTMNVQPDVPKGYFPDPSGQTNQLGTYTGKGGSWVPAPWQQQFLPNLGQQQQQGATGIPGWLHDLIHGRATPTPTPTPEPNVAPPVQPGTAPQRTLKPGQGGYIPGRSYSGMTYLGGNPNDRANWQ